MKKLSFLELEKEMEKEQRIIKNGEELKSIRGGMQPGFEQKDFGLITNNDHFSFKKTTIVRNASMTNPLTTVQDNNNLINTFVHPETTSTTTASPTTTNPCETDYGRLMDKVNSDFDGDVPANTNFSIAAPPGYSIVTDSNSPHYNEYKHQDTNGNTVYSNAVTQAGNVGHVAPDGSFSQTWATNIYVSPSAINSSGNELHATVGHELIHENNILEHRDLFENNRSQFDKNSEYAAWEYEHNYYQSIGDSFHANQASYMMNQYEDQGANTSWDATISDTTTIPTSTSYPTTTIPTTAIPTTTIV